MSEKSTSLPQYSWMGILGTVSGIVANILLFVPGVGLGAIITGAVGFVLSFLGLGMAKKSQNPDLKFIISGVILSLVGLGLGIYFQWFIAGDTAPPDPDLQFLDSIK